LSGNTLEESGGSDNGVADLVLFGTEVLLEFELGVLELGEKRRRE